MAALANSGVPTVNPALNVKQQLALAILGGQGTATQMLRERRKHMVATSQPKGMFVRTYVFGPPLHQGVCVCVWCVWVVCVCVCVVCVGVCGVGVCGCVWVCGCVVCGWCGWCVWCVDGVWGVGLCYC